MIEPSEMTDDQLRLAIAEELGITRITQKGRRWYGYYPGRDRPHMFSNWPGNNNAAMGLLKGMAAKIELSKDDYARVEIEVYFDANTFRTCIAKAIDKSPARAISEAVLSYYKALKARGNDG